MKIKKLLSVLTAAVLSVTMCLSTSIFASAEGTTVDVNSFYDLQNAVNNESVSVINITGDIDDGISKISFYSNREITINFNGYTVHKMFSLNNSTSLILNGKGTLIGGVGTNGCNALELCGNSSVKANNMNIIGGDATYSNGGNAVVTIDSSTAEFDNCYLLTGKSLDELSATAISASQNSKVKLRNCTIEQNDANKLIDMLISGTVVDFDGNQINPSNEASRFVKTITVGTGYIKVTDALAITNEDGSPIKGQTPVSVDATIPKPSCLVVIPATVHIDEMKQVLPKYENATTAPDNKPVVSKVSFNVFAKEVDNLFDDLGYQPRIELSVKYDGKMTGKNDSTNTLPYTISKGDTIIEANKETVVKNFKNESQLEEGEENSVTLTARVNRTKITAEDDFTGILTFIISIPATETD